jgi:hypothetical protein
VAKTCRNRPNEFDDTPVLDIIEEKLGRELDDKEADFVTKIEKRYRRYVIEGELHDHDMVRISPRWEITTYEPLELWPMPPGDIMEFWNYIAYAFYKRKLPYPEFMSVITDLGHVQKKMADWEQEREVASWYDRIEQVNERPPQDEPITVAFRLVATINEARLEVKEQKAQSWLQLREKNDIEHYITLHHEGALLMDAPGQTLWEHFLAFFRKYGDTTLDFDQEESCRFMNRVFRQPALKRIHRQLGRKGVQGRHRSPKMGLRRRSIRQQKLRPATRHRSERKCFPLGSFASRSQGTLSVR